MLIVLLSAVRVFDGRVAEVSGEPGFEVLLSVSSRCILSSSSSYCTAAGRYRLRDR